MAKFEATMSKLPRNELIVDFQVQTTWAFHARLWLAKKLLHVVAWLMNSNICFGGFEYPEDSQPLSAEFDN